MNETSVEQSTEKPASKGVDAAASGSARLAPGWYRRTWAGYTVLVEIRRSADGALEEVAPSGLVSDPASMPDAEWSPVQSFVRMFKPQFAALVESGAKTQTVRPTPERMPQSGDRISLRCWTGAAYRSKQRVLREAVIVGVDHCEITETGVIVNSYAEPCDDFARADGFRDFFELADWFRKTHGLPFEGVLIRWQNTEVSREAAK